MNLSYCFIFLLHKYLLVLIFFVSKAPTQTHAQENKSSLVSAIFVFGDSTADSGNNNYILTPYKSNFSPYGRDFPNHVATGRTTNGLLTYDFIARYVGVKECVPPYLDQSLSIEELRTGVSFASVATGIDPLTAQLGNVISLSKQLEHFKEYKEKMEAAIGKEQTQNLIKEALFIFSAGTNDFFLNYNALPIRRANYTVSAYIDFLLQHLQQFLQELMDQGARKIAVAGMLPIGCLPIVITLHSFFKRDCYDYYSSMARDYDSKLQNKLNDMQIKFANLGSRFAYMDLYTPLMDMIQGHKYDFEKVSSGCCGLLCTPLSSVCPNASNYVFWDSVHPTERAYYIVSQALQPAIDSITKY